jgi:hypothetical protein
MSKICRLFFLFSAATFLIAGLASAQDDLYSPNHIWSDQDFKQLAKPATVPLPPGTEITTANWQQYKDYMTLGMQTLFRGDRFFKILPGQKLVVGPTISVPLPKLYQAATEKYAGTASIVPAPDIGPGAVALKGYRGGVPFPNPQEPDLGAKIEYNSWFAYVPAVVHLFADVALVDHYHDVYTEVVDVVLGKTSFVTDVGYPETNPALQDIYRYTYTEVDLPEEARYTAALDEWHSDPAKFTDLYAYVPALRRVLRLSPAAVCAPVAGTDDLNDDNCANVANCQQIPLFDSELLGEKKILALVHANPAATERADNHLPPIEYFFSAPQDIAAAGFALTRPNAGLWELRDVYVLAMRRIPSLRQGYCYGTRVFYIDKETWHTVGNDLFDAQQKYWKNTMENFWTMPIPGTSDVYFGGPLMGTLFDFQNFHTTCFFEPNAGTNKDAGKYNDTTRYATPGGMQQINQ